MSLGLRVEDRLDGKNNYSAWKERIQSIFEDAKAWGIMVNTTQNPVVVPTDPVQLAEFNKKNAKAKRLILEGVKDHVIPHVRGKTYAHEMWTALISLYQSSNENRKMVLKEKLKTIKMAKTDSVIAYLTKITSVRDELAIVGEIIAPTELVRISLNGLPKTWENFVDGTVAQENVPNWERLWDDCIRMTSERTILGQPNRWRRMTMWHCEQEARRAEQISKLPTMEAKAKKKNKKGKDKPTAIFAEIESFSESFDRKFGFIACEATNAGSPAIQVQRECALPTTSIATSSIWYVDSGASHHMTAVREYFSELSEDDTDMEVVLGDDNMVRVVGVGTLTFDRGPKPPLKCQCTICAWNEEEPDIRLST
eukprot:PITA_35422